MTIEDLNQRVTTTILLAEEAARNAARAWKDVADAEQTLVDLLPNGPERDIAVWGVVRAKAKAVLSLDPRHVYCVVLTAGPSFSITGAGSSSTTSIEAAFITQEEAVAYIAEQRADAQTKLSSDWHDFTDRPQGFSVSGRNISYTPWRLEWFKVEFGTEAPL